MVNSIWEYDACERHADFLKKIRRDKSESKLVRAAAYGASAALTFFEPGSPDGFANALNFVDKSTHLLDSADASEKQRLISMGDQIIPAIGLFESVRQYLIDILAPGEKMNELWALRAWSANGCHVNMSFFAGLLCDFCEKHRDECENGLLSHCSRCRMVFYCSEECQQRSWTEDKHGKWCRKKGEFRKNDIAVLAKDCQTLKGGTRVRLIVPFTEGEITQEIVDQAIIDANNDPWSVQHWVECEQYGEILGCVSLDMLKRIRAPVWRPLTSEDIATISEILQEKSLSNTDNFAEATAPLLEGHKSPELFEEEQNCHFFAAASV